MQFINGIATGAPVWVWPLFLGLVALGLLSTRQRSVSRVLFLGLPLLVLLSLNSMIGLARPDLSWPSFLVGYLAGAYVAYGLQSRWMIARDHDRLLVEGEWLTLTLLMIIFWANFLRGAIQSIAPHILTSAEFLVPFALVLGLASGSFLGRSIRALRFKGALDLA